MLTLRATSPAVLRLAPSVYVAELTSSALAAYVSSHDPILRLLHAGENILPDLEVSVDDAMDWTRRPVTSVREVYSRRPDTTDVMDPTNVSYDDHTYGHPVNPGLVLFDILRGLSLSGGAPRGLVTREHFTRHRNLTGQLDLRSSSYLTDHYTVDYGSGKHMLVRSGIPAISLVEIDADAHSYELGFGSTTRYDIRPFFNFLEAGVWSFDYTWMFPGLTRVDGYVSNFSYSLSDLGLKFSWSFKMHQVAGDEHTVVWDLSVSIPPVTLPGNLVGAGHRFLDANGLTTVQFRNCYVYGPPGDPGAGTRPDFDESTAQTLYFIISDGLADAFPSLASVDVARPFSVYTGLDSVGLKVDGNWWDITALASNTSVAAFDDLVTTFQSGEKSKILSSLGTLGSLAKKLDALNIKTKTFTQAYQLVKNLSGSVRLPQYRAALSAVADFEALLSDFAGASDSQEYRTFIGRAHRSYDLSSMMNRDVTLNLRTRATLWQSPHGLAESLLGADAVKFYLDLVKSWRSFPYQTFLVRALGVDDAISNFRAQIVSSTIPMWFVHTYTFFSPFTVEELDGWNAVDSSPEDSGLRVFYRDVSTYLPIPRPSAISDSEYTLGDVFRLRDILLTKMLGKVL